MANLPAAEISADPALVRQLVREQHPDLGGHSLTQAASGWDNYIYRLGTEYAIRLPRRQSAAGLTANEQRWLPQLTADVPVSTSAPLFRGTPCELYPWPWSITAWFDGQDVSLSPRDRNVALAEPLAAFLNAFHRPAPADYPRNPFRGGPLADRAEAVQGRLNSGMVPHAARVQELWDQAQDIPAWTGPPLWLHGDLHPANLVAKDNTLQAVIDFGDLTAGDPATDLAAAWLVFDAEGRDTFRRSLGDQYDGDPYVWERARGWAMCMATILLANSDDAPGLYLVGSETLMEILTGDRERF
ncbi:aminoglycoside phosphotransferase family protein [Arthrobacter sp. zg-Y1116]|uniref:aminoglycoside phosphotransferase family protein n=1 Tax=Arthrobacter sp. zg-Y1116 TaxID=2964611 RepID=UPI002105C1F9|nr:aminoglycoside phosphotransferase family protein [Arthrobacter sp. zg-Y1116]MCQ1947925.1 aminoglycoside phosphotransferase family protein [Arthrobacter sp. zg-Y1116]